MKIRRDYIIEDAFEGMKDNQIDPRNRFRIMFVDSQG